MDDLIELDETPTGAFGLPKWKYMLRLHAACLGVTDKPLTPKYRMGLADMLGDLEHQIETLRARSQSTPDILRSDD